MKFPMTHNNKTPKKKYKDYGKLQGEKTKYQTPGFLVETLEAIQAYTDVLCTLGDYRCQATQPKPNLTGSMYLPIQLNRRS